MLEGATLPTPPTRPFRPTRSTWSTWLSWRGPPHALWLGRNGLWDYGARPGWRRPAAPALTVPTPDAVTPLAVTPLAVTSLVRTPPAPVPHASFDAWCQAHPGAACELAVSSWLVHELLLDAALPLADDPARLVYARGLLQHYHGDEAAEWPLAAWQVAGRHGVSALHGLRLPALQHSARQAGVALRAVRPWWSLALALARPLVMPTALAASASPAALWRLLVVDGSLVTQIDLVHGTLDRLQNRCLGAAEGPALQALVDDAPALACHALGHGLVAPVVLPQGLVALAPLDGPAPAALWRSVDVDQRRVVR